MIIVGYYYYYYYYCCCYKGQRLGLRPGLYTPRNEWQFHFDNSALVAKRNAVEAAEERCRVKGEHTALLIHSLPCSAKWMSRTRSQVEVIWRANTPLHQIFDCFPSPVVMLYKRGSVMAVLWLWVLFSWTNSPATCGCAWSRHAMRLVESNSQHSRAL